MTKVFDLLIVGGGPAGINCAIEAEKANLHYCILEKGVLVNSIYHFPMNMTFFSTSRNLEIAGIPFISHTDKPTRREALEYYRRLVNHFDVKIKYRCEVLSAKKQADNFVLQTSEGQFESKNLIIATGFYDTPQLMDVPGESLPKVKHYYDDAHEYIGMNVLVVGAANSACDVALETWSQGANVTMAVREPQLYQKVKYWILPNIENRIKEGSIKAHFNTKVKEIKDKEVILEGPEGIFSIENDFVLAMTGYKPDFKLLDQLGIDYGDDQTKVPVLDEATLQSTVSGLYLAGVINGGMKTSALFIENTRDHGEKIVGDILNKK